MDLGIEGKVALVTAASKGLGFATAQALAAEGCRIAITARDRARVEAAAERLPQGTLAIVADMADPASPARIFGELERTGVAIDALVNNAGYGLPGGLLHSSWEQHRDFIQVMVTAVAELCYRFAPGMAQRQRGWIINVASVAGLVPGSAGHTLYGAVKSLVVKFSQSLALELRPMGVNVTALCPGFTYSEFHDVNGMRQQVSQLPKFMWMDADTVARQGYEAVMRGDIIHVNGRWNKSMVALARYTPDWLVNGVLRKFARKFRRV